MNVSVVVATCGDTKWLTLAQGRAVPSAFAVIGDRTDRSLICRHYPDLTVASARNEAAKDAPGDWLAFLDADDELESGYLDAMERALRVRLTTDCLLVPLLRRVHGGKLDGAWATYPNKGQWPRLNECVIGTLVRRDLFERVGGFRDTTANGEPISMYDDWDLWLRCWQTGARLVYTDAVYREHVNMEGRNTNAHLSQQVYDAIWRDHETRMAAA